MVARIIGEKDIEISENLDDKQSELILCSLYNVKRYSTKLHLFFDKKRFLVLAVLANERGMREIQFPDEIRRSIYSHLLAKSNNKDTKCDCMSKWEFLNSNTVCYRTTSEEESELTKLLLQKQII